MGGAYSGAALCQSGCVGVKFITIGEKACVCVFDDGATVAWGKDQPIWYQFVSLPTYPYNPAVLQ